MPNVSTFAFDAWYVPGSDVDHLDMAAFVREYLPVASDPDILAANTQP